MSENIDTLLRKGIQQQEAGRSDLAHSLFQQALRLDPDNPDAWHLDGIVAFRSGNLQAAEKMIQHAIEKSPDQPLFRTTLGNVLRAQGRFEDAIDSYDSALSKDKNATFVYFNRATLLQDLGRHEEAIADLDTLLSLSDAPESLGDIHALRAESFIGLGQRDKAVEIYESALRVQPDHIRCRLGLAEILELQACLDEALTHTNHILERAHDNWHAARLSATILRRQGKLDAALKQIQTVDLKKTPLPAARQVLAEHARILDRREEFEEAFEKYEAQNRIAQKLSSQTPVHKDKYLGQVLELLRYFSSDLPGEWRDLPAPSSWGKHPPVFLVGFPRSGTTLLDQILDAHPDIHVVEERPLLLALRDRLRESPEGYPAALGTMSSSQRDELRALYREQLQGEGFGDAGKLIVNKLPLNLIHTGLIHRVFPEARIILALRHPCDVILSCFMQDFTLNNSMANFLTLKDSAHLYDKVMSLWSAYQTRFNIPVHELRYESLIDNFDSEVANLLNFLELPWKDEVRDFAAHARMRPLIRTPSYEQVTGELHNRSRGRWRNYFTRIEPHIKTLEPHIDAFDYNEN
ncbi:MAG: sulfotransferase [Hyphomicrobiales bacterium]|nr:sulfotransferase [Hyphomicrobiales bacterium]